MAIALALLAAGATPAADARAPGKRTLLTTRIDPRTPSRITSYRVPQSFLGFSMEINAALRYTGTYFQGVNAPFAAGMNQLAQFGGGVPTLRFGGVSADLAWWNPDNRPRAPGVSYDVTPFWVDGVSRFIAVEPARVILGLNFVQPRTDFAVPLAQAAKDAFGPQTLLEYGNEPDLYGFSFPYVENGVHKRSVPHRRHWTFGRYLAEFDRKAAFMRRSVSRAQLAAPGFAGDDWIGYMPKFLQRERNRLGAVVMHSYALCTCVTKRKDPGYPSLAHLLAARSILGPLRRIAYTTALARHYYLPLRVTETGSISGGGGGPLGASFANALWGLNWMFATGEVGVRGLDFHTSGTYTPAVTGFYGRAGTPSARFLVAFRPLFYSMLLFARATGNGARFLPDATFRNASLRRHANLLVWATVDRARTVNVVVVNSDLHARGAVQVRVPPGVSDGSVIRLTAPSPRSTKNVTLAGQQFAFPTSDGTLQGPFVQQSVRRRHGGVYRFNIAPASAALLTVRTR